MSVGSLVVDLSADIAKFTSSMDKASAIAEQRMQQIDKSLGLVKTSLQTLGLAAAAGLSLDAIKNKIEGVIQSAAGMEDLARRTGATVEMLSGLAGVAKISGTDMDSLATGMQKLAKAMVDAENGGTKSVESFKAIGISVGDLKGKNPAQVFELMARRSAEYEDGAGKLVVAQNLLGKAGANLLPVMHDLSEVGDLQVKVTTEQAKQAHELEVNWRRLQASSEAVWKTIGLAMIPTLDDFVKTLLNVQTQSGGLKETIDQLARDHTLRQWAQDTAIGVANFIETLETLAKTARAVAGSFESVWADIKLGAQNATPGMLAANLVSGDLAKQLEERNKTVEAANKRYVDLWNFDKSHISDDLKRRFELSNFYADSGLDATGESAKKKKVPIAGLGNNNGPKDDPARALMNGIIKLQEDAIAAQRKALAENEAMLQHSYQQQYMTASQHYKGKIALIDEESQAELAAYSKEMDAAQAYINQADTEQKRQEGRNNLAQATTKYLNAQADAEARKAKATTEYLDPMRQFELSTREVAYQYGVQNAEMQFQLALMGMSTVEAQKLTAQRQIDLQLQQEIHALKLKGYSDDQIASYVAEAAAKAEAQKAIVVAQITSSYDKQRDAIFGAHEALRKYAEDASNTGAQIESVMTSAFKGMEDALVSFVTTGKLNFKSLVDSIIADIARMVIRSQITGPLAKIINGALDGSGGGGGIAGLISSLIGGGGGGVNLGTATGADMAIAFAMADGGDPPVGKVGLVGERGPELFVPRSAGTVIPNELLGGGDSGGAMKLTIVNNTSAPIGRVTERAISKNERALVIEEARTNFVAALHDPNSPESRAMQRVYAVQRRR
jgi:lambda family phage tail tape measure protein